jgi:hypothetical protein
MAARVQDLTAKTGRIYRFPIERARAGSVRAVRLRRSVAIGLLALGLAGLLAGDSSGGVAADERPSRATRTLIVRPGDSLWDVAAAHAPEGTDPRAYVDALVELNDLDGGAVPAGARLRLPR